MAVDNKKAESEFIARWVCPRIKTLLGGTLSDALLDVLVNVGARTEDRGVRVVATSQTEEERFRWYLFTAHGMAIDAAGVPWVLRRLTPYRIDDDTGRLREELQEMAPSKDGAQKALAELHAFGVYMPALVALSTAVRKVSAVIDREELRLEWRAASPGGAPPTAATLIRTAYSPALQGEFLCMRSSWGRCEVYCRAAPDASANDAAVRKAVFSTSDVPDAAAALRMLRAVYKKALELQLGPLLPRLRSAYTDNPQYPHQHDGWSSAVVGGAACNEV